MMAGNRIERDIERIISARNFIQEAKERIGRMEQFPRNRDQLLEDLDNAHGRLEHLLNVLGKEQDANLR